ncbi:thioredoxin family protein [Puteibacter caeruleilacunae]|nr:thioredoxin family protein [Puteibacter caeruleilacunae]
MEIKILGTGCAKCKATEKVVRKVTEDNNVDATIIKEESIMNIMAMGVMTTPAIAIDNKVVLSGRIPSEQEFAKLLAGVVVNSCNGSCCC